MASFGKSGRTGIGKWAQVGLGGVSCPTISPPASHSLREERPGTRSPDYPNGMVPAAPPGCSAAVRLISQNNSRNSGLWLRNVRQMTNSAGPGAAPCP
jgi:hypothetical protein